MSIHTSVHATGRVQSFGPRMYRHSDGTMSATRPAPSPLSVASRSVWRGIVSYCREAGGDPQYKAHGEAWSIAVCTNL